MEAELKKQTGVSFEPHVLRYLDELRQRGEYRKLNRSQLLNIIVEDFAEGRGTPIAAQQLGRSGAIAP